MATKIRCKYLDCAFLDEGYCSAAQIDLDSDKGCLMFQSNDELPVDDIVDDEDIKDWDENEEENEDEDDPWIEDDDDEEEDDYN